MKSPFPGMDPYLEQHWHDVHTTLIVLSRAALQAQLGDGLRARIEERLIVESNAEEYRDIYPDVRVFERGFPESERRSSPEGAVAVAEPLLVSNPGIRKQRFIEIIDVGSGGKLITVIEFLSPSNRLRGDGRDQYLQKQDEIIHAGINFVAIDLTRAGRRQFGYPISNLPDAYQTPYLVCVFRGFTWNRFEFYRVPLQEPLPAIRIPLRVDDEDARLHLQPLIERAYVEGAYDDIDYSKPPRPPLEGNDGAWAEALLRSAGKR